MSGHLMYDFPIKATYLLGHVCTYSDFIFNEHYNVPVLWNFGFDSNLNKLDLSFNFYLGVPYIQSKGEAEALCSLLNVAGVSNLNKLAKDLEFFSEHFLKRKFILQYLFYVFFFIFHKNISIPILTSTNCLILKYFKSGSGFVGHKTFECKFWNYIPKLCN